MECDPQCEKMEENMITCYGPVRTKSVMFVRFWFGWFVMVQGNLQKCAEGQDFPAYRL